MMKKMKRILAVLLAAAMCLTMLPAMAFAEEPAAPESKEVNLVVFGNSTSSGYGMPDFYNHNNGFATNNNYLEDWAAEADGYTQDWYPDGDAWTYDAADYWRSTLHRTSLSHMSVDAYPWQLKRYMVQEQGIDKVNLTPVTMNGMRTDELRSFLDKDFYQEASEREYAYAQRWIDEHGITGGDVDTYRGFLNAHMGWYIDNFRDSGAIANNTYDEAQTYVKNSIKDADVIVFDLCNNNFGTYMGYRLSSYLGMEDRYASNTYETIDDVRDLPDGLKKTINSLKETVAGSSDVFKTAAGSQLLDTYIYSVADCIVNFRADMEMIREINPDAKIIAVGLNNPMEGLGIANGDMKIDLGAICGKLFDLVNTYIKAFDKNANNYYYADLSGGMTTFASCIEHADSLEALLADGNGTDGRGKYTIDRIYRDFVRDFMGENDEDYEGDSKTVYSIIQGGIKEAAPQAAFSPWNSMNDGSAVTFDPGTFYLTVDQAKLAAATSVDAVADALGFSPAAPAAQNALTKAVVKQIAVMYQMSRFQAGQDLEMLAGICQALGIADPATPEAQQQITGYIYTNLSEGDIARAYGLIQNGVKAQAPNAGSFSELSDTASATFKPGTMYVTVNLTAASLMDAFNYSLTSELSDEEAAAGKTILTKGIIKQLTAAKVKPLIQQMLYEALHEHQTLDIFALQESLADMDATADAIKNYLFAVMTGQPAELDEAYWGLLTIEERFLLSSGVGEHPNKEGCDQKYEAVKKAYLSEKTAYEESKAEVAAMLEKLAALLDGTPAADDIAEMMALIAKIQNALPMIDEAQELMAEYKALRAQFEEYLAQALDTLGITMDDLIAQAEFIRNSVDVKEMMEFVKVLNEVIKNLPSQEELKEELQKQLETLRALVEEKAGEIAQQLYDKIMEINEKLKEAVGDKDYEEIMKELEPVYEQLKEIGMAVVNLPEYEKAMDALAETVDKLSQDTAALQDDVYTLKRQVAKLTAKAIDVEIAAAVTFPKNKAQVDVSWALDSDAAGYVLKVDGREAAYAETEDGFKYTHTGVKIGQKYTYEVTPYIVAAFGDEQETIYGKTFKKVVTPKVKVAKAKIKSVKAAKKAFTAKWSKVKGASGYQLSYKTGKKTRKVLVKGAAKVSKKVGKLQSKKQYTVKVRAYKLVNSKKYWGKWSTGKKVTVK